MSWRTVIISRQCKLDYKMGYLVIRGEDVQRVFLDEMAILVVENPAVALTGCLLEALTEKKIKVIFCDSKRSPIAELVPYHGSHNSSQKIRTQAVWPEESKAAVWQAIIREKIGKQADFLMELEKKQEAELLQSYIGQVEPMDVTNREGHAAKVYFNALFGMEFTRSADVPINAALNYGYSMLLAAFNREVAAAGYLTQLGIFHDNMFNHFNLSCDLMEPFRILVDRKICEHIPETFDKDVRHALWEVLNQEVLISGSHQTVLNAIRIYSHSVFETVEGNPADEIQFYNIL